MAIVIRALTVRLPDETHERLMRLAERRGMSLNRMIGELVTLTLAELDAESRFASHAQRGRGKLRRGLQLLQKSNRRAAKG
jgi:predicted transcriptional regulator